MNTSYLRQVELVMRSLLAIAEEPCFALKGGTAINLFEINLPRLSVDIDLTYTIISGRAESILGINTAGHNRPLHELLNPILQNHRDVFTQQFAGMSDAPFTYEEHEATFAHLRKDILASLTDADRQNLLDFVSLAETMPDFCIPELMSLPAILWKRHNLEVLRKNDPHKFSDQHNQLARIFE